LRNADFGLRIDEGRGASNPQSEIRIPQWLLLIAINLQEQTVPFQADV